MRGIEAGVNAPASVLILNSIHTVERIELARLRYYRGVPKFTKKFTNEHEMISMIPKMIPMIPIIAQNGIKTNDGDGDCDGDGEENKFRTTI